jgi:hypothetical protein
MQASQLASDQFVKAVRNLPQSRQITQTLLRGEAEAEVVQKEVLKAFGTESEGRGQILGLAALHSREKYYRSALQTISALSEESSCNARFDAAVAQTFSDILTGTQRMGAFDQHARGVEILCERWPRTEATLAPNDTTSSPVLTDGLLVNDLRARKNEILSGKSEAASVRLLREAKVRAPNAIEDLFRHDVLPWIVTLLEQSNSLGGIILSPQLYATTLSRLNEELRKRPELLVTSWHKDLVLPS